MCVLPGRPLCGRASARPRLPHLRWERRRASSCWRVDAGLCLPHLDGWGRRRSGRLVTRAFASPRSGRVRAALGRTGRSAAEAEAKRGGGARRSACAFCRSGSEGGSAWSRGPSASPTEWGRDEHPGRTARSAAEGLDSEQTAVVTDEASGPTTPAEPPSGRSWLRRCTRSSACRAGRCRRRCERTEQPPGINVDDFRRGACNVLSVPRSVRRLLGRR